jgi:hypothetical protein
LSQACGLHHHVRVYPKVILILWVGKRKQKTTSHSVNGKKPFLLNHLISTFLLILLILTTYSYSHRPKA